MTKQRHRSAQCCKENPARTCKSNLVGTVLTWGQGPCLNAMDAAMHRAVQAAAQQLAEQRWNEYHMKQPHSQNLTGIPGVKIPA